MINIHEEFISKQAAIKWMNEYYRRYHPCGYGTQLHVRKPSYHNAHWQVTGWRFNTCD